jgi:hypothetical protein
MSRSTSLIVRGLLIAVAPVMTAALGAVMTKNFGNSGFGEVLHWSILLLVITIPIGAAMVAAGILRKM